MFDSLAFAFASHLLLRNGEEMILARMIKRCKNVSALFVSLLCILLLLFFRGEELLLPNIIDVNRYYAVTISPGFEIKPPFSFPQPDGVKSVEEVSNMNWFHDLANIMAKKKNIKIIYLLACDNYAYPSLLNWLVAAYVNTEIDIEDILVLSLDEKVYRSLLERDISTIYIKTEEFIRYYHFLSWWETDDVWLHATIRMSIARLMSHWGFNVAIFDVDAIPLKDLDGLYKVFADSDIISSHSLKEAGKFTGGWSMSLGFAFFRSNKIVEYLWEYSSNITDNRWQDQKKLSQVINNYFNAQWRLENKRINECQTHLSYLCDITGVTTIGLKITLLSRWAVCRYCGISRLGSYYIWHKQSQTATQAGRQLAAEDGSVWFLRKNWEQIDKRSTRSREIWLHELCES